MSAQSTRQRRKGVTQIVLIQHQPIPGGRGVTLGQDVMLWAEDDSQDEEDDERRDTVVNEPATLHQQQTDQTMAPLNRYRRRNSISLPAGLDNLEVLPVVHEAAEASDVDSGSDTEADESFSEGDVLGSASEDDTLTAKAPLRRVRKKSVMPPRLRLNGGELPEITLESGMTGTGADSPANSVTSINSLSSLLKEKLVMSFPGVLRRKRPREYKLKAFVAILFLCIVFLVGFAYILYHQQVLQREYFERIRFNKEERQMRVYNAEGYEVVSGHLGRNLGGKAYRCLPRDEPGNGAVCLEWVQLARLVLRYRDHGPDVRCYHVTWISLNPNHHPTDCFDWSPTRGHWYGGGLARNRSWPLEGGNLKMAPFITGNLPEHEWANVLQRYFINSRGVSIIIDDATPLYLNYDAASEKFCLQAKHDDFAYVYHTNPLPQLNYSLCASNNMKSLHGFLAENSLWDGVKEGDVKAISALLLEPVWQLAMSSPEQMTEAAIANLTEDVIALGFPAGHVLLNEMWQPALGDLKLDETRFPTFRETVDIIHRRGFRIVLTVQPFISTESSSFMPAVRERLLVSERGEDGIPALTRYKGVLSAGVIDVTKNQSAQWLQGQLRALMDNYAIDAFYLDLGSAYDMPHYYQFHSQLTNPDQYKTLFTNIILNSVSVVGVSSAVQRPRPPVFVSLPPLPSGWESLQSIVPATLTYGLMGYPFIMPGPIGGECDIDTRLPDRELYIRWLQLATFLPVIVYRHMPNQYDSEVERLAQGLAELRKTLINPLLIEGLNEALEGGLPLVRPLWMLEPLDTAAQTVDDEFCVCDKIIVAPVLRPEASEREIYLPAGVWRDGIDGSLRKGHRWIHNYKVPLEKVAYFIKMPNNTRF
ncbi:hypothetical protein B566_EDAN015631 [Ephemera danica]|nr:hypothetical protein B566_EDAN015631 [Ephemera danica]